MPRLCRVGGIDIGHAKPLAIIAGPCVLESLDHSLTIGRTVQSLCAKLGLAYIFKASFDKANRSSINSPRGPGLERGLEWLGAIRRELNVPITTDIHEPSHAEPAAAVVDLLQIPAFLSRQTDLLQAAGHAAVKHKRAVNVKKGQFMAPSEMKGVVRKLAETGCENVMLTERGTFFGYHRLVNDFLGVADLIEGIGEGGKKFFAEALPPPVCFDCTHSTQLPGAGETTGGRPERAPALARAATAIGVHALFIECHPDPAHALSDGATVQPMDRMESLLTSVAKIRGVM
jgi:2-dehydro-3-deoxyphosphooctonate aldolase (KDO 8-P synthase)